MAHQDYVHLKTIDTDIRSFILQKNKKLTIESQIPFITFMNYHFEYIKEKSFKTRMKQKN